MGTFKTVLEFWIDRMWKIKSTIRIIIQQQYLQNFNFLSFGLKRDKMINFCTEKHSKDFSNSMNLLWTLYEIICDEQKGENLFFSYFLHYSYHQEYVLMRAHIDSSSLLFCEILFFNQNFTNILFVSESSGKENGIELLRWERKLLILQSVFSFLLIKS